MGPTRNRIFPCDAACSTDLTTYRGNATIQLPHTRKNNGRRITSIYINNSHRPS
uniref:Uncharacterized protein n=1 Tax=Zea mays TaxID=4577 RepID=C0PLH0_MAIZE|nr:unknown [Zea mays]